jgi:hypothetical protein
VPASPNGARAGVTVKKAFSVPLRAKPEARRPQSGFPGANTGKTGEKLNFFGDCPAKGPEHPRSFLSQLDACSQRFLSPAYRSEIFTGGLVYPARRYGKRQQR